MAKVVVGAGFPLNTGSIDLADLVGYDVTSSGARRVVAQSGQFTAILQGPSFSDFDSNGLPHSGEISTFTLNFSGVLALRISKIDLSMEELISFALGGDADGLRSLLFDGADQIYGGDLADNLLGYGRGDLIEGGLGADTINGGTGADQISGDLGRDLLIGGLGADIFKFRSLEDSATKPADADYIQDLRAEDIIDLRAIDADVDKAGNNAFRLVDGFTGENGQAWLEHQAQFNRTLLKLDVDGDSQADMIIVLKGDQSGHDSFIF